MRNVKGNRKKSGKEIKALSRFGVWNFPVRIFAPVFLSNTEYERYEGKILLGKILTKISPQLF